MMMLDENSIEDAPMADATPTAQSIDFEDELSVCPECDYKDGFHVAFVRAAGALRIELICPSCSARYNLDRTI